MTPHEQLLIASICPAIQAKNIIRFWYENSTAQVKEWRIVEPYLIGMYANRSIQLSGWLLPSPEQIQSGKKEAWRSYILKNISQLQILGQFQNSRQDFDPQGSGMKEIFCSGKKDAFMRIV